MRIHTNSTNRGFEARVISGTHTILVALDCPKDACKGLMGFAFERQQVGAGNKRPKFLRSQKVFRSIVPDPKRARDPRHPDKPRAFYSDEFPVQSFLWGDYAASPGTTYRFRVLPMFGKPGELTTDPKDEIRFTITTEIEWGPREVHGVWFNRGAIASQKFAEEFGNKPPQDINNPKDRTVKWLSRGLLEACLAFINETQPRDALRVAAYEFTYPPILDALKALIDPLSDDPLVCSGSANFSSNSLLQNDENMLLIRGNTRVADIYMTEFDRIFRHFYFRDNACPPKRDGQLPSSAHSHPELPPLGPRQRAR